VSPASPSTSIGQRGFTNSRREVFMSWSPCSNCRRTDQGPLQFMYIATFPDGKRMSHRLRLCITCANALLADVFAIAERQDALGRWLSAEEQP
jgi:hypothetical protein